MADASVSTRACAAGIERLRWSRAADRVSRRQRRRGAAVYDESVTYLTGLADAQPRRPFRGLPVDTPGGALCRFSRAWSGEEGSTLRRCKARQYSIA